MSNLIVLRGNQEMIWKQALSPCTSRKRRRKTPRQIWYISCCEWALRIMKFQEEDTFKHCNYREELLDYIRALAPNNIKSEILEDSYEVSLKELCEA